MTIPFPGYESARPPAETRGAIGPLAPASALALAPASALALASAPALAPASALARLGNAGVARRAILPFSLRIV
jgi:hypothetical protein